MKNYILWEKLKVKLLMELQTGPSMSESLSCVIELWYFMAELQIYIINGAKYY